MVAAVLVQENWRQGLGRQSMHIVRWRWWQVFFLGRGKEDEARITDQWTDTNEVALDALKNLPIKMGHTAYGRFEVKDIKRAYKKMMAEEENDLMWKLAESDVEDTNEDESTPPSPIPV